MHLILRRPLSYDRGHSSNTFNMDACADKKQGILHKKGSDTLNLPMTPKFSNKGSSMTLKNSDLAETLIVQVREPYGNLDMVTYTGWGKA